MNRQQRTLRSALSYPRLTSAASPSCRPDAQRALLLLEEYRAKLHHAEDRQLRHSIQRVIDIFQSNLFQALIGTTGSLTLYKGSPHNLEKSWGSVMLLSSHGKSWKNDKKGQTSWKTRSCPEKV